MTKLLKETTPMMKQWQACKNDAGSALLLFRLGDFYEAFFDDAKILASTLMITLTKRSQVPMAGIPAQTIDNYLDKLLENGLCVAIAEQVEKPSENKGIVERKVTRILTPATYTSNKNLNSGTNNFLLSISYTNKKHAIAYVDISTSEFFTSSFIEEQKMLQEILRIRPKEILVCKKIAAKNPTLFSLIESQIKTRIIKIEPLYYDNKLCLDKLHKHLNVLSLDGFGLKGEESSINACGALFTYLENDIFFDISIINSIKKRDTNKYLTLDHSALSHLEIFHSTSGYSLFNVINHTKTPMGERLLKNTLLYPLLDIEQIQKRQDSIKELINNSIDLSSSLSGIKDLERLMTKIANKKAHPSDLLLLARSLEKIPLIINTLSGCLTAVTSDYKPLTITEKILNTIVIDNSEYFIQKEISEKLDKLKELEYTSSSQLKNYEDACKQTLGIKTLKIGHSRSFGYYLEVSKKSTHLVPSSYTRKQTLVNGERYITQELKALENAIMSAKTQAIDMEQEIFNELVEECITNQQQILLSANLIAKIDLIYSLKLTAATRDYICPNIQESDAFQINQGCHPVLLSLMKQETFIPNDIHLDSKNSLAILTGPNMAGKSTYIKSVALLTILTQIGSFIPAKSATLSIVDKIFTRIGALDDLQRGQSTFMVEMTETANILRNATNKSLIILDEIGRGTSTFDGIALAKSIATYIVETIGAKTLFATHYLELTELSDHYSSIKNIKSTVLEKNEEITFLHKIEDGKADQSYGIFVGSLAGLPEKVITDAKKHIKGLSLKQVKNSLTTTTKKESQYNLFEQEPNNSIIKEINSLDINNITPFNALQKLIEWKKNLN